MKKKNKDKKKKSKRHRNDSHHDSDFSSDESESYRNDRRKLKKQGHKKRNYDSDDSDVESRESQQRRTDKKRSGRKGYSSHEDTDSDQSRGRHKGKRIGSRKHLDDSDSDLDYESSYRPNKKYEPRSKTAYRNDDDLERPSVEESVRQARSILKTVKQTEKSANGGVPVEVQQVMNAELSAMIAQLREQKQEMERRLRESEIEATKLRLEKEASQRQIVELETRTVETQKSLQTTKNEARNLQANQTLEVATREAETIKVSAELEQVRKERLEMSKMIQKLEAARESMKDKLKQAQEESIVLRTENSEATKKINAVEKDREELQKRLAQIQQTRTDVERRLQDAAKEANVLKALKKVKAHEIREERASTHVRESYLNEMESERRGISKNLKMMEQEKKEMMVMMDQLDSSRHRLNSLMEEASGMVVEVETKNDESISLHDAITSGNQVAASATNSSDNPSSPVRPARYHQPSLATIHSPRHLMSTPTLSKVVSLTNLERFPTTVDSHLVVGGTENVVWKEKMQRTVSAKSLQDARPSGWLGEDIFNRSCNEMGSLGQRRRREPTEHARTSTGSCNASGDQIPPSATETELLRLKRDKARQSERRLRSEMQKSRSNQSLNSSVHSFDP